MNASSGCTGLPLTKLDNASLYSCLEPYSSQVYGDTGEVLCILGDLKSVTGVIRRQVRDKDERLSCSLLVVVDGDLVCPDCWHVAFSFLNPSLERCSRWLVMRASRLCDERIRWPRTLMPFTPAPAGACIRGCCGLS